MLTIKERERLAYITNAPVHPLLGMLVDEEWNRHDELTHQIDGLQTEVNALNALKGELQDDLSQANARRDELAGAVENIRKLCVGVGYE